jgi:hypothetical protein
MLVTHTGVLLVYSFYWSGAYCFTPVRPSVRSSHLVCIVCPANSSNILKMTGSWT